MSYISEIKAAFQALASPDIASGQSAYMRNQFAYYGVSATVRKLISKPFQSKEMRPSIDELGPIAKALWQEPERELQYFTQELVFKYAREFQKGDIKLFEYLITNKSWWDTVDFIAAKILGAYFKIYPEEINPKIDKWLASNNMWLHRSAILFQLKYKNKTNADLLGAIIINELGSKEFFINKAIGWALREYSKTNAVWVRDFCDKYELSALSRREALRLMK